MEQPLLIIYKNDLTNSQILYISKLAHFILYVDDANTIFTGQRIHEVIQKVGILSTNIVKWLDHNGL